MKFMRNSKRSGAHRLEQGEENASSRKALTKRSKYSIVVNTFSGLFSTEKGVHASNAIAQLSLRKGSHAKKISVTPYKLAVTGIIGLFIGVFGFVGSSNETIANVASGETTVGQSASASSVASVETQTVGNWGGVSFNPGFEAGRIVQLAGKTTNPNPPVAKGNGYVPGQCTWYVYNRRAQLGIPIKGNWGNASEWGINAVASGFSVDHNPVVGDVIITGGNSFYGHVAVVEKVLPNNSVYVSEMNYGGPFVYHEGIISNATSYYFIH
jgi:surface antigen